MPCLSFQNVFCALSALLVSITIPWHSRDSIHSICFKDFHLYLQSTDIAVQSIFHKMSINHQSTCGVPGLLSGSV